jgi:hypothetical protein
MSFPESCEGNVVLCTYVKVICGNLRKRNQFCAVSLSGVCVNFLISHYHVTLFKAICHIWCEISSLVTLEQCVGGC